MHPFSAMFVRTSKSWKMHSPKFDTVSCKSGRLWLLLWLREILIRVDLIHGFRVKFAEKAWRVNNLIYGTSFYDIFNPIQSPHLTSRCSGLLFPQPIFLFWVSSKALIGLKLLISKLISIHLRGTMSEQGILYLNMITSISKQNLVDERQ